MEAASILPLYIIAKSSSSFRVISGSDLFLSKLQNFENFFTKPKLSASAVSP